MLFQAPITIISFSNPKLLYIFFSITIFHAAYIKKKQTKNNERNRNETALILVFETCKHT